MTLPQARHADRRIADDRRGVAALEFALIAGMLVTLFLGVWDVGNAAQQEIRLQNALRVAGEYALSFPTDAAGIVNQVTNALPAGWTDVMVTGPTYSCSCWSATQGSFAASGTAPACSCPAGSMLQQFLEIGASRPFSPLLIRSLVSISSHHVVRFH